MLQRDWDVKMKRVVVVGKIMMEGLSEDICMSVNRDVYDCLTRTYRRVIIDDSMRHEDGGDGTLSAILRFYESTNFYRVYRCVISEESI